MSLIPRCTGWIESPLTPSSLHVIPSFFVTVNHACQWSQKAFHGNRRATFQMPKIPLEKEQISKVKQSFFFFYPDLIAHHHKQLLIYLDDSIDEEIRENMPQIVPEIHLSISQWLINGLVLTLSNVDVAQCHDCKLAETEFTVPLLVTVRSFHSSFPPSLWRHNSTESKAFSTITELTNC